MRDILTAVREGRLDPTYAGQLLDDPMLGDGATRTTTPADPADADAPLASDSGPADTASAGVWADVTDDPTPRAAANTGRAARTPQPATSHAEVETDARGTSAVRVRAMTRRVRVVADPTVQTVSVDGPHELRREGTVLVLESDRDFPFGDPFAFLPTMRGGFRLQPPTSLPFSFGTELVVRLNPEIDLDVDVTAGSLLVRGVGRVRARVTAGSARIEGVGGPLDLHVVGGTARVDATIRGGDNRIRCDSGSLVLHLRRDSDVRLRPDAQLGRITIDGAEGGREIVVGSGTGRLDVEIAMGSLQVEVQQ